MSGRTCPLKNCTAISAILLLTAATSTTARTVYVDNDGPADFNNIQAAIIDSNDGDTVIVHPGLYLENINFMGKNITLTGADPDNPDSVASTVLDARGQGSVVTFHGDENSTCVLKGFTISGGGIGYGGGICGNGATAAINRCVIIGNVAGDEGGGLYKCNGEISNCVISSNSCHEGGGGLSRCDGPITNCIITSNSVLESGGGLCLCDGPIINCTIAYNKAWYFSGGIVACYGTITNCIIWGNVGGSPQLDHCSTPSYSCIQDWADDGVGNISADPCFAYPNNGDYHLMSQAGRWDANGGRWTK
jgi:hypothetical protein